MNEAVAGFVDQHLAEVVRVLAAVAGDHDVAPGVLVAEAVDALDGRLKVFRLEGLELFLREEREDWGLVAKPNPRVVLHAVQLAHPLVHSVRIADKSTRLNSSHS